MVLHVQFSVYSITQVALSLPSQSYLKVSSIVDKFVKSSLDLSFICSASEDRESMDRLLMRTIPKVYRKGIFTGDIVAFRPPEGTDGDVLVRRVAAVEGEEMTSDDPDDEDFRLPEGETALSIYCHIYVHLSSQIMHSQYSTHTQRDPIRLRERNFHGNRDVSAQAMCQVYYMSWLPSSWI